MKYRIAVIGTGYMARKHCDALISHENTNLVTICSTERSKPIADEFSKRYGFTKTVTHLASILDDPSIDIVFVCTPDYTHPKHVISALQAGKHVFCEKPLARTSMDFQQIRKQLETSRKVLQIGMNCRFRDQYSIPKQIISSGELGRLRFLRGTYIYNAVQTIRNREKVWVLQYPPDIFPFLHGGGIHCLDLLRWIGGDIKAVFGKASAFELASEYKGDTFLVYLDYMNGAMGELLVSGSAYRPNDFGLEMWLSEGSIIGTTVFRKKSDWLALREEKIIVEQKSIDLALQYGDMVRSIESGSTPLNSFEEAYKNFKVLKAIEQSINSEQVVYVKNFE